MSTPMNPSLPWPTAAEVLPIASVRPVLDRLASLATVHAQDVVAIPGLAVAEDETAADPPPALEQIADELGGIELCGQSVLTLLVENRTDVGPYTLLGEATSYYPLHETPEAAVVLTLDEDGAPGAVYGIGEDLALRLAAPDLPSYLARFTDALETVLAALSARGPAEEDSESARAEAAEQLMDEHLFGAVLGTDDEDEDDGPEVLFQPLDGTAPDGLPEGVRGSLPEGTLALADLRSAPVGARVDPMEVEHDGDPLALHLAFRAQGLLVAVLGG